MGVFYGDKDPRLKVDEERFNDTRKLETTVTKYNYVIGLIK